MKLLVGLIAAWTWCIIMAIITQKMGLNVSADTQVLSTAIIAAGAMAGTKED